MALWMRSVSLQLTRRSQPRLYVAPIVCVRPAQFGRAFTTDKKEDSSESPPNLKQKLRGYARRAAQEGINMTKMMYFGTRDLAINTGQMARLKFKQDPLSRRELMLVNRTFITDEMRKVTGGSESAFRNLAKQVIDDINHWVANQTGDADDGIENKHRAEWENLLTKQSNLQHATIAFEDLLTPALLALASHVVQLEELPFEVHQRCLGLFGTSALAFPGKKLVEKVNGILDDDKMIRKEGISQLTDNEVYEALLDRGYLRPQLDAKTIPERRHMLERWCGFTQRLTRDSRSAIVLARAFDAR